MSAVDLTDIKVRRGTELVLDLPRLSLSSGSQTLLTGASGSGKSTLINLLAGFLKADSGRYTLEGQEVAQIGERAWDKLRGSRLGVVFQHYPLLKAFSVLDNLLIPMRFAGNPDRERAVELLTRVGLGHRLKHRPSQLSAGQRQRAALVRAVVNRPALVLADEPTAHLDPDSGGLCLSLLRELASESGSTLLLVSHDMSLKDTFDTHLTLEGLQRQAPRKVDP